MGMPVTDIQMVLIGLFIDLPWIFGRISLKYAVPGVRVFFFCRRHEKAVHEYLSFHLSWVRPSRIKATRVLILPYAICGLLLDQDCLHRSPRRDTFHIDQEGRVYFTCFLCCGVTCDSG